MGRGLYEKIIFLFLILGVILISGCATETPIQTTNSQPVQEQIQQQKTEERPPQKETQSAKTAKIGENVEVDYLGYKVTKAETFTEMGTSVFGKETNGKFVKVYLGITNNAKETKQIFTPRFKLVDNQDRQFDRLSDDILYISDGLELGKQLQPSLTASGAIVFELPSDSEDLKLVIRGDWISTNEVVVELSSIKDIGKDTTQKDEQDKMMDETMADAQKEMDELMEQFG